MKTRFELATLLASLLFFLQPAAQSPSATLPGVPAAVREAMLRGDTKATLEALDRAAAQDPKPAATLLYLRAVALAAANRRVEALAVLDQLERSAPNSTVVCTACATNSRALRWVTRRWPGWSSIGCRWPRKSPR